MHPDSANAYPSGNTASIWMGTFEVPDFPPLSRDLTTDVCVIGAGIAGLSTAYHLTKAGKKVARAHRAGASDVTKVHRATIAAYDTGPALRWPNQGQFHVLKYLDGLARAIVAGGGEIYCGTHVSSVSGTKPGHPCKVETENEKSVTAQAVCVCTNASITDMVQTHAKQAPYRTFAIAAVVLRSAVSPGLYWDTPGPYAYVPVQALHQPHAGVLKGDVLYDALILGGEDFK